MAPWENSLTWLYCWLPQFYTIQVAYSATSEINVCTQNTSNTLKDPNIVKFKILWKYLLNLCNISRAQAVWNLLNEKQPVNTVDSSSATLPGTWFLWVPVWAADKGTTALHSLDFVWIFLLNIKYLYLQLIN